VDLTGLGLTAVAGLAYSAGYEVRAFTLRRASVPVLTPGSAPITVLHLSDLHLTPSQHKKINWLRRLADTDPDFVIVTGDFWAHRDAMQPLMHALEPLLRKPGAFVFGSNDYYAPKLKNPARYLFEDDGRRIHGDELPWQQLQRNLTDAGWIDLTHTRATKRINDTTIEFRGVDDAHLERDDYRTIQGPAQSGIDLSIGVTHAPYLRVLNAMADDGCQLVFAGHTHGGQLRVPGVGALVTNCDLDRARARGLSKHRNAFLHVSAGCGTNPFTPVRFACRPEATLLTLEFGG
jgi:predicted MPP superfamily phosphohydrolase